MAQVSGPTTGSNGTSSSTRAYLREGMETVVLALLLFVLLRVSIQNFRVEGSSMEPNIHGGEYVFVKKLSYIGIPWGKIAGPLPFVDAPADKVLYPLGFPKRGDVVVFHAPGGSQHDFVKRVIGLPGDKVEVRDGVVYVNGRTLEEDYIKLHDGRTIVPVTVPGGELFVMGDNRPASNDSRAWGSVPVSSMIGRVWVRYWPPQNAHFLSTVSYASTE